MAENLRTTREKFNDESKNLFPKQPQQQRQDRAGNQARHDGKMKTEIAFGIIDIAGQTT
jgi:hypothetical protein